MLILGLCLGGALGAPARFLVASWVQQRVRTALPVGTLAVNASGSLALGLLTGAALYRDLPPTLLTAIGTGFCGAYTTFSTFAFETVRLVERRAGSTAALNVAASLVLSITAAALGVAAVAVL